MIVLIHLMAIIIFVLHILVTEYNKQKQVTRLQLGNDNETTNPTTQDTPSYTKSEISLETILTATSIIILMRWIRQWI